MNEITLIENYLNRMGAEVTDMFYMSDGKTSTVEGANYIGKGWGFADETVWFFGNVNLNLRISGVITLTDQNVWSIIFRSIIKGQSTNSCQAYMGVNFGMSLIGDGAYRGMKRLYGVGFNNYDISKIGFSAGASFVIEFLYNGYFFVLK